MENKKFDRWKSRKYKQIREHELSFLLGMDSKVFAKEMKRIDKFEKEMNNQKSAFK